MATTKLTRVAILSRRGIKYTIYFFIFLVVARITINLTGDLYRKLNPAGPPPPTIGFGPLPAIKFPQGQDLPELQITIETPTGTLPEFPTQAKVFFMPRQAATLSSLDNARTKATSLGFTNEPIQLTSSTYRFNSPSTPSSLEMNIITGEAEASYNLAFDPSPLGFRPPSEPDAIKSAKALLNSAGLLASDLNEGRTSQDFLRSEGRNLVSAISLSEANLIRVNLFREDIDTIPSITPNPLEANVWVTISGSRERRKNLIALKFKHFPISPDQSHTYPLKTAEDAAGELLNGSAHIANLGLNPDGKITIRDIYLAYYDPDVPSEFYQPIIVFEGDRDFFAYVPAVTSDYYTPSR